MKIKSYVVGYIGTNCFLVWDEASKEALLIDPGAYDSAIKRDVKSNGLSLKYIVLTHGHGDHIGGVPEFRAEYPDAKLVCGKEDLELIGNTAYNTSDVFFGKRIVLDADLTPGEGETMALGEPGNGTLISVLETPGHTKGGLSFYISGCDPEFTKKTFSGTVFSGDTLFHLSVGRTDLYGGDYDVLTASIQKKLFALPDDTLVLPGHMNPTIIEHEKKHNPYV